jgi:hypothetical protein
MGTRGLTKVIYKGQTIIAQYGQWDHYPEGQGVTLFHTLTNPDVVKAFIEKIPQIYYPSDEELEVIYKSVTEDKPFDEQLPSLTRNTGGEIFRVIANWDDSPIPIFRDIDFEKDELFCEGVYTINLDTGFFHTQFDRQDGTWRISLFLGLEYLLDMTDEDYIQSCKDATLVM